MIFKMKKIDVKKLIVAALLASFVCVATMIIQIPNGIGGYFNLGDCIVLLCGWLLGPIYGALAAGIGSALADVFSSFVIYAPATFVIKALMAITAFFVAKVNKKIGILFGGVLAEFLMAFGYFAYECFLYGAATAALGIVPNTLQGVVGLICALVLKTFVDRKKLWKY